MHVFVAWNVRAEIWSEKGVKNRELKKQQNGFCRRSEGHSSNYVYTFSFSMETVLSPDKRTIEFCE
jgi:hypothetical protein